MSFEADLDLRNTLVVSPEPCNQKEQKGSTLYYVLFLTYGWKIYVETLTVQRVSLYTIQCTVQSTVRLENLPNLTGEKIREIHT